MNIHDIVNILFITVAIHQRLHDYDIVYMLAGYIYICIIIVYVYGIHIVQRCVLYTFYSYMCCHTLVKT